MNNILAKRALAVIAFAVIAFAAVASGAQLATATGIRDRDPFTDGARAVQLYLDGTGTGGARAAA